VCLQQALVLTVTGHYKTKVVSMQGTLESYRASQD